MCKNILETFIYVRSKFSCMRSSHNLYAYAHTRTAWREYWCSPCKTEGMSQCSIDAVTLSVLGLSLTLVIHWLMPLYLEWHVWNMCNKPYWKEHLCALQVFLWTLASQPVCARTCAQLRGNIACDFALQYTSNNQPASPRQCDSGLFIEIKQLVMLHIHKWSHLCHKTMYNQFIREPVKESWAKMTEHFCFDIITNIPMDWAQSFVLSSTVKFAPPCSFLTTN